MPHDITTIPHELVDVIACRYLDRKDHLALACTCARFRFYHSCAAHHRFFCAQAKKVHDMIDRYLRDARAVRARVATAIAGFQQDDIIVVADQAQASL
jgi:hypothetical protein